MKDSSHKCRSTVSHCSVFTPFFFFLQWNKWSYTLNFNLFYVFCYKRAITSHKKFLPTCFLKLATIHPIAHEIPNGLLPQWALHIQLKCKGIRHEVITSTNKHSTFVFVNLVIDKDNRACKVAVLPLETTKPLSNGAFSHFGTLRQGKKWEGALVVNDTSDLQDLASILLHLGTHRCAVSATKDH